MSAATGVYREPHVVVPLRVNFAWTSIGHATYAACQWAMVSVLAKLGSAEIVGQYALGLAATAPTLMLAQLNLRSVLATDPKFASSFPDYRDLRFASLGLAAVIFIAIAASMQAGMFWIALLAGAVQGVEAASDIYHGLYQRLERMDRIAISYAVRGVLSVFSLALGYWITTSLAFGLLAVVAARLLVLLVYDQFIALRAVPPSVIRTATQNGRTGRLWRILITALPLGLVLMIGSLVANAPRYFAAHHLGESALGIFSAIASLATGGSFVVNALGQAATPRLAQHYAADDRSAFQKLTIRLALMGGALCVAGVVGSYVVGGFVLRLAYRPEYGEHVRLLAAIMLATGVGYTGALLGYAMTAARMFREQVPLQIASLVACVVTSFFAVPWAGLMGAAAAVGAGSAVQVIGEAFLLRRWLRGGGRQ